MDSQIKIGIIGGSGLYGLDGLTNIKRQIIDTPFGTPSDTYITGNLNGTKDFPHKNILK